MSDFEDFISKREVSALTAGQLAAALAKLPPDAKVWLEGCDCSNPAREAHLDEYGRAIIEAVL